jgi:preprotein translocase subunit SecG
MADILFPILATTFCVVCVFMILLILIQKGRGGGLSSAFGGAGGNTAFGSKTGDVLTWVTAVVFVFFLILSMSLIWTIDVVDARNSAIVATDPAVELENADDEIIDDDGVINDKPATADEPNPTGE